MEEEEEEEEEKEAREEAQDADDHASSEQENEDDDDDDLNKETKKARQEREMEKIVRAASAFVFVARCWSALWSLSPSTHVAVPSFSGPRSAGQADIQ